MYFHLTSVVLDIKLEDINLVEVLIISTLVSILGARISITCSLITYVVVTQGDYGRIVGIIFDFSKTAAFNIIRYTTYI